MLGNLQGLEAGLHGQSAMISGRPFSSEQAYKDSKLCNVIATLEMARRLSRGQSSVTCNCLAPGFIPSTGLFREYNSYAVYIFSFFMRNVLNVAVSEEEGGKRLAYMVDSPDLEGVSGAYYARNPKTGKFEAVTPSVEARDIAKAGRLWELTERLLLNSK
jgi:NAD(P)-dependent dehydrogenase (short-subunit alcohol dehydrogenase family)